MLDDRWERLLWLFLQNHMVRELHRPVAVAEHVGPMLELQMQPQEVKKQIIFSF
jgi:hypothetical protein